MSLEEVVVRKSLPHELESIASLRVQCLNEIAGNREPGENTELVESVISYLSEQQVGDQIDVMIAESSGEIVGTCFVSYFLLPPKYTNMSGRNAYITNLYVQKDFRKRRIGERLLSLAIEHVDRRRSGMIVLHATKLGRRLYEKFGFREKNSEMVLPRP